MCRDASYLKEIIHKKDLDFPYPKGKGKDGKAYLGGKNIAIAVIIILVLSNAIIGYILRNNLKDEEIKTSTISIECNHCDKSY